MKDTKVKITIDITSMKANSIPNNRINIKTVNSNQIVKIQNSSIQDLQKRNKKQKLWSLMIVY